MRKLFLASSFSEVASLFPKFACEEIKGKRITFIPTASLVEEVRFYVDDDRKAFEELGIIVEELEITTAHLTKFQRYSTGMIIYLYREEILFTCFKSYEEKELIYL